jgi:hypothetical protein
VFSIEKMWHLVYVDRMTNIHTNFDTGLRTQHLRCLLTIWLHMFIHRTYVEAVENESPTENGTIRLLKNINSINDVETKQSSRFRQNRTFKYVRRLMVE